MRHQSGEGRLGFIVTLALFVTAIFLAVKIVPVRIAAYEFREVLRNEAANASTGKNDEVIRKRILERAADLDIPIEPEDLSVRRSTAQITIRASYEQPVDLKLTRYVYRFQQEEKAPLF
jgi:hypothetical protein